MLAQCEVEAQEQTWAQELEDVLPAQVNRVSPEQAEAVRRVTYVPESVRIEEVRLDPETGLQLVTIAYEVETTELVDGRYESRIEETILQLRGTPEGGLLLDGVDFTNGSRE